MHVDQISRRARMNATKTLRKQATVGVFERNKTQNLPKITEPSAVAIPERIAVVSERPVSETLFGSSDGGSLFTQGKG